MTAGIDLRSIFQEHFGYCLAAAECGDVQRIFAIDLSSDVGEVGIFLEQRADLVGIVRLHLTKVVASGEAAGDQDQKQICGDNLTGFHELALS